MKNNLIELFPDMDTRVAEMSIDEHFREAIQLMKDSGECVDPDLWAELKILCPPDRYPREMALKPDPYKGPPRTLRQVFGLGPLRPKKR